MAVYEVETEDGSIYEVETLDDAQALGATGALMMGIPFSDELRAAASTVGEKVIKQPLDWLTGQQIARKGSWGDVYDQELSEARAAERQYVEENPVKGTILPIIGGAGALPNLNLAGKAGSLVAKPGLFRSAAKAAGLAGEGAAYGGLYGFSEGQGGAMNRLESGGKGAAVGGVAAPAMGVGIRTLGKVLGAGTDVIAPLVSSAKANQAAEREAMAIVSKMADSSKVADDIGKAVKAQDSKPFIQRQSYTNLDPHRTTAELISDAQKPGIASLEQTLRLSGSPEAKAQFTMARQSRDAAQKNILERLQGEPMSNEAAAEVIRPALEKNLDDISSAVGQAAEKAKNPADRVNIWNVKKQVSQVEHDLTKSGAYKPTAEVKKFIDDFRHLPKEVPLTQLQDWRSRAGQLGQELTNKRDQSLVKSLFSAAAKAEETAIEKGTVSRSTARALKEMRALRAEQGQTFEQGGVGKALEKEFGKYIEDPSKITKALTATQQEAQRTIKALGASDAGKDALAKNFMSRAIDSTVSASTGKIQPGAFPKFVRDNKQIAEIVGGKKFSTGLQAIADDMASIAKVEEVASRLSRGQSISTQGITNALALKATLHSAAKGMIRIPLLNSALTTISSALGRSKEAVIEQKLVEFVLNPRMAQKMLERADDKSLGQLIDEFSRIVVEGAPRSTGAAIGVIAGQNVAIDPSSETPPGEQKNESYTNPNQPMRLEQGNQGQANQQVAHTSNSAPKPSPNPDNLSAAFNLLKSKGDMGEPVAMVEQQIDADPYFSALYEAESGRNPSARNPKSSATGGFQFISATAKALGIKDPTDLSESFSAVQKMTAQHDREFGESPEMRYAAHYMGATLLRKVVNGAELTEKEQKIVDSFNEQALPRFLQIYGRIAQPEATIA